MGTWRLFIPTRDSSAYIGVFLKYYRMCGIEPYYVVDGRSSDRTIQLLADMHADFHVMTPENAFGVTEMLQTACHVTGADWLLRMDDDEFPSRTMLGFVWGFTDQAPLDNREVYLFSREWLVERQDGHMFFRAPRIVSGPYYDTQRRLIRNADLIFDHSIHTVGVETNHLVQKFPPLGSFIVHFDPILKSTSVKLAKMRRYDQIARGTAWQFADLYLPEVYGQANFLYHDYSLDEFRALIADLPPVEIDSSITLTDDELRRISEECPVPLQRKIDAEVR